MGRIKFLNTCIDNLTMQEAIDVTEQLIAKVGCSYVVTPNLDHIVTLENDQEFAEVYSNADLILADGKPLIWISKLLKTPIQEKISGSDFFPKMCEMCANKGYSIFILGAAEGVAEKAAENLCKKYKGLKIVGTYSPPLDFEKKERELKVIKEFVTRVKPDVLAVSLGSPKGEKYIYKHLEEYGVSRQVRRD